MDETWVFDTVRIMSDMCQTKKKKSLRFQSASAAVKCNPSTSGFVHRECLSNGIIFSRIDRWNTALCHFTIVSQCLF